MEASRQESLALERARRALHYYVAAWRSPQNMVYVDPGEVYVGESASVAVALDGFFIDEKEVTNGQFAEFCSQTRWGYDPESGWPARFQWMNAPADHPVTNVTFYDALAYAAYANKRLPTEAQWARAAYGHADAPRAYPWGKQFEYGLANLGGVADCHEREAPGGSFSEDQTRTGCWDMLGNVSEWTCSAFSDLPYDPLDGREDLSQLYFGSQIVVRGSNYQDARGMSLSTRYGMAFEAASPLVGFRCVIPVPATVEAIEALL